MFSCRAAWQRCGLLARRAAHRLPQEAVQQRLMSSVPGGSGENVLYTVLCGGALVGALSYAYVTVTSDRDRYNERVAEIQARPKTQWAVVSVEDVVVLLFGPPVSCNEPKHLCRSAVGQSEVIRTIIYI
uniref:Uncharacterized protein n=1 Tax=Nothobranchius pienaari TaxID=704102 RepID=A0A1A8Q4S3_9TELE